MRRHTFRWAKYDHRGVFHARSRWSDDRTLCGLPTKFLQEYQGPGTKVSCRSCVKLKEKTRYA